MHKRIVIGLTGGIGSGKSAVSSKFEQIGITIVDADIVAREVVALGSDGLNKISAHFGLGILNSDKTLNRAKLREIIFKDEKQKIWLNNLMHPMIRTQITLKLEQAKSPYVILVAPLLFENNLDKLCQRTLLIDVPVALQIDRTTSRDKVSSEQVKSIIASQMPREQKQALADDILNNSQVLSYTEQEAEALHLTYLELANSNH
ncbi:dephospho-CoA kinase [Pseudoalteromonas denitrificans]|jgi:dephospho-CoA kinase|uniref:Dephospho-CoA kinase n=1 Tax=Pseudoalteromonas denitrificans DSM 6059 TaxID=1123010 RepID=A0A1I1J9C0_9GAMM|nr:dephospho-CoA kinase [Pseudoalteromonas denitrificans]SFC44731.1 dephospho-CoA kinase [Pseudoalteromonas denitrificans DSM 6059]